MNPSTAITIGSSAVALDSPTYFIADIGANHDGDLRRAKDLIHLCAEAGANAAKFQHFLARHIVSDIGFQHLGDKLSHQATWSGSVYENYERYELDREWTGELAATAKEAGVAFMTTPYDAMALDVVDALIPAFKIGSGDVTWTQFIELVAQRGKPVLLATGASTMEDCERAIAAVLAHTCNVVVLQCNTNYSGDPDNFKYLNLNVLRAFNERWPGILVGLSDHTPGHAAVLGAVALGARVVEKHFTDDPLRDGPDHRFSMTPTSWRDMVDRTRELELALGDGIKRIEPNEMHPAIVQRRCLRVTRDLDAGDTIAEWDLESLRPAPEGSVPPYRMHEVVGRAVANSKQAGDALYEWDVV